MDSEIDRAPNLIGKYLLSGWVLTDTACSTPNCNVPLLRSKDSTIWFCVLCDKEPGKLKLQTKQSPNISSTTTIVNGINNNNHNKVDLIQQNSIQSSSQYDIKKDDDIKDELQQQQIRRDQSQRASHLISQYLLRGWAIIDQTCPNETCYGVPLVRSRDKKKYCVICQNCYMNESDMDPLKHHIATERPLSLTRNDINENKHQIDIKEIESTVQQLGKKVQFSLSNDNNTTSEQNIIGVDNHQHNAVQKCIPILSSKLEELSVLLENASNISDIKIICDTIKSCAHALEAVKSLEHP